MGILFWRGRVSKKEFRRLFMVAMHERLPHLKCGVSPDDELGVLIDGVEGYEKVIKRLDNAYLEFRNDPRKRDDIISRWADSTAAFGRPLTVDRAAIVPVIKPRIWLATAYQPAATPPPGSDQELAFESINDELIGLYASFGATIHFLKREDLAKAGIPAQEAHSLARANLRARTPQRDFVEFNGSLAINVGGNFEAAMLLDEEIWKDPCLADAQTVLVAVPDRNTILAGTDTAVDAVWKLAFMADNLARTQAHPITSALYARRAGRFEPLDPAIVDETHPIPRLDVIDVFVKAASGPPTAGVVVATPLSGEPRSVFRLFRKLESYMSEYGCAPLGETSKDGTTRLHLFVRIHRGSDPAVIALLESLYDDFARRGASLKVGFADTDGE